MTQKMCFKAVDTHFVTDQYNTQEMCDKIVSDDPFKAKDYLIDITLKKCVIKPLMVFYQYLNFFLIG